MQRRVAYELFHFETGNQKVIIIILRTTTMSLNLTILPCCLLSAVTTRN
jgi:hypothetical protein